MLASKIGTPKRKKGPAALSTTSTSLIARRRLAVSVTSRCRLRTRESFSEATKRLASSPSIPATTISVTKSKVRAVRTAARPIPPLPPIIIIFMLIPCTWFLFSPFTTLVVRNINWAIGFCDYVYATQVALGKLSDNLLSRIVLVNYFRTLLICNFRSSLDSYDHSPYEAFSGCNSACKQPHLFAYLHALSDSFLIASR